jgi:hypothetical protein
VFHGPPVATFVLGQPLYAIQRSNRREPTLQERFIDCHATLLCINPACFNSKLAGWLVICHAFILNRCSA